MTLDPLARASASALLVKLMEAIRFLCGLLGLAPGDAKLASVREQPIFRYVQDQTLAEFRRQGFKTNDLVEIPAGSPAEGSVVVNGVQIRLTAVEALLFHVLVQLAQSFSQNSRQSQTSYVAVPEIIAAIDRERQKESSLIFAASNLTKTDIHKAVNSLRGKLSAEHLNPFLIDGQSGKGYRLGTPRWNLIAAGRPLL